MNKTLRLLLLLVMPAAAWATPTAGEDHNLAPFAVFEVGSMRDQILVPPPDIARMVAIEYASLEPHRGIALDINHSGILDYIFADNPNNCAQGGCPLILIDGSQKKIIGRFYGNPLYIIKKAVNGRPIISVFRSEGQSGGYYASYAYNDGEYTEVSSVHVEGDSLRKLQDSLKIISPGSH